MSHLRKSIIALLALIWLAASLLPKMSVHAQDNALIVLDDATPSANVVITPSNGAAGVVYAELDGAVLKVLDASNTEVLSLIDKRVSAVGIQLAQNAQPHTLRVERLPGMTTARVQFTAQSTLPEVKLTSPASSSNEINGPTLIKTTLAPANTIPVTVTDSANMLTAQFAPQDTTVQLADASGKVLLAGIAGKQINAITISLTAGQYALSLANGDLNAKAEVVVSLSPAPALTMAKVVPTATTATTTTTTVATPTSQPAQVAAKTCTGTVSATSTNLRSGPGTAYSVLGLAARGNSFAVGGVNKEKGWLLVQSQVGGAWISDQFVTLAGDCNTLTVFDIPVRNASVQAPVIVRPTQRPATNNTTRTGGGEREGREEHEGGEHDD